MKTSPLTSKTESNASFHPSYLNKENKPAFFSQKEAEEKFFGRAALQPKLEIGSPDDASSLKKMSNEKAVHHPGAQSFHRTGISDSKVKIQQQDSEEFVGSPPSPDEDPLSHWYHQKEDHTGNEIFHYDDHHQLYYPLDDPENESVQQHIDEQIENFITQTYEEENFQPSTGRGLFDAYYNPRAGHLTIRSKLHLDFKEGDPQNERWQNLVEILYPEKDFSDEEFQWNEDEKEAYRENLNLVIQSIWSGQYTFQINHENWERVPQVRVRIDIQYVNEGEEHYKIDVIKWPKPLRAAFIRIPQNSSSSGEFPESGEGGMGYPDIRNNRIPSRNVTEPYKQVFFEKNKAELNNGERQKLYDFGVRLSENSVSRFLFELVGRAGKDESDPDLLSEKRANEARSILLSSGIRRLPVTRGAGNENSDYDTDWQRVDINIKNFQLNQRMAAHEFGHIFGLADEYPSDSRDRGDVIAHSDLAEELNLTHEQIVAHYGDSIMSVGGAVMPWHYATFLEVLTEMTGVDDWGINRNLGDYPEDPILEINQKLA